MLFRSELRPRFETVEARNADEALRIMEGRKDIQVIFTDVDMPGSMNGLKLAEIVRERWPQVGILIVSGHHQTKDRDMPHGAVFFAKPYDSQQVTETLKRLASSFAEAAEGEENERRLPTGAEPAVTLSLKASA